MIDCGSFPENSRALLITLGQSIRYLGLAMSNPILPIGTEEATSNPFFMTPGAKRTFTFLGSGTGTVQLQKVRSTGVPINVPDAELSADNAVFNVEGDGYYVWYRAETETGCGVE